MAFQFTLEAVLRFRRALEAREEQRLAALLTRRATLLRSLEQSLHAGAQKKSDLQQFMSEAEIPMAEIQFVMAQLRARERYRSSLRYLLQQLQREIEPQTSLCREAQRRRQLLESVRENQLREYRLRELRREQSRLDELYLIRRLRAGAGHDLPS